MTKFRCIKGNSDIPVGTIIEGELSGETIVLTKDSTVLFNEEPYFQKGEPVKLTGYVWQWESCEGEPDKEDLLARFEYAIESQATYRDSGSDILIDKATKEYESAREELLKRLS